MVWESTLDLSFLKPLMESDIPTTDEQAIEAGKQVAEKLRSFEYMDSVSRKYFGEKFSKVKTVEEFDSCLEGLYDEADIHRIWVKTCF